MKMLFYTKIEILIIGLTMINQIYNVSIAFVHDDDDDDERSWP